MSPLKAGAWVSEIPHPPHPPAEAWVREKARGSPAAAPVHCFPEREKETVMVAEKETHPLPPAEAVWETVPVPPEAALNRDPARRNRFRCLRCPPLHRRGWHPPSASRNRSDRSPSRHGVALGRITVLNLQFSSVKRTVHYRSTVFDLEYVQAFFPVIRTFNGKLDPFQLCGTGRLSGNIRYSNGRNIGYLKYIRLMSF